MAGRRLGSATRRLRRAHETTLRLIFETYLVGHRPARLKVRGRPDNFNREVTQVRRPASMKVERTMDQAERKDECDTWLRRTWNAVVRMA
jgi:hypothetical protein